MFKIVEYLTYVENCVLLAVFYVFHLVNLIFLKAKKVLPPKQFIFYHPYESINFGPAGFLAFKEKSGPLLPPYLNKESIYKYNAFRFTQEWKDELFIMCAWYSIKFCN